MYAEAEAAASRPLHRSQSRRVLTAAPTQNPSLRFFPQRKSSMPLTRRVRPAAAKPMGMTMEVTVSCAAGGWGQAGTGTELQGEIGLENH